MIKYDDFGSTSMPFNHLYLLIVINILDSLVIFKVLRPEFTGFIMELEASRIK
jgi:hypothetical protein